MVKRVLLKDIAEKLNITTNTVSRALNDKPDISFKTKEQVREVAKKLGYVPDVVASSMRTSYTNTVAVLFDNLSNPYFMIVANLINNELLEKGYQMMIFTVSSKAVLTMDIFEKMIARRVDGVISFLRPEMSVATRANQMHIPIFVMGREADDLNIDSIFTDDFSGGHSMAQYFYEKEYKYCGYLGGPEDILCNVKRAMGFKAFFTENKMPCEITYAEWDDQTLYSNVDLMIQKSVDSIFCFNDSIAYSIMMYIEEKYPNKQIEVTGYDNIASQIHLPVKITTVGSNTREMVKTCVRVLMEKIQDFNKPLYTEMVSTYLVQK